MSAIAPEDLASGGCSPSVAWEFNISIENTTATAQSKAVRRLLVARQDSPLTLILTGGVLSDQLDRTGYITSSGQFQFDSPPLSSDAIYTAGFSACSNGSLALGGSAVWWSCLSGGYYNLYFQDQGTQCTQILVNIKELDDAVESVTSDSASGAASSRSVMPIMVSHTIRLVSEATTTSPTATSLTTMSTSSIDLAPSLTASGSATSSQSTLAMDSKGQGSLSTGASAGIGVAVGLVFLTVVFLGMCYGQRRRRHRQDRASTPPYAMGRASSHDADRTPQIHEKDGRERQLELDGEEICEADGREKSKVGPALDET